MLSEAQKRVAQLLGIEPDDSDTAALQMIDECLKVEANKGPLEFARHVAWMVRDVLKQGT